MPSASPAASTSTSSRIASQLARYGLTVGDVQEVIGTALGGEMVTTTVEGRERFGVSVRYPRELRSTIRSRSPRKILVPVTMGRPRMMPLGQLATVKVVKGAPAIRTENALLSAYIYRRHPRPRHRRLRGRCAAGGARARSSSRPATTSTWSGQFEYMQRAMEKMKVVIPVTLADHLPAALPQLPPPDRNPDRHAVGAVRAGRRRLADVGAGLQPLAWRWRSASSPWPAWRRKPAW